MADQEDIKGSGGGKGGGGSQFFEADNTLQSTATVRLLEVISEGPIVGLVGGGRGIYLNNVPLENQDGTKNFGGKVAWDQRVGLPSQPYMAGFPSATSTVPVNVQVTTSTPAIFTVSSGDIDAVRVTIALPEGLALNDTSNNQLVGSEVELAIDRRLGAGTWSQVKTVKIQGKTTSPYEEDHRIDRPGGDGSGVWSVRLRRITADNSSATLRNNTYFARATEIEDVKKSYPDTAYVGIAVDARSVSSSQVPTRSYLADGRLVLVPSNYNPVSRTYSGIWDGEFKAAWTDNPAWIVYDLLIHPRYGLGEYITADLVDAYSFYSAAVYCDELVSDGDGGQQPRFTFNYPLTVRQDAARWIEDIAGAMNARVVWMGGKATLIQDRPADVTRLITTSNVVDGRFTYRSSSQQERVTAVNVMWNNPAAFYQQEVVTLDKYTTTGYYQTLLTDAQNKYGYNSVDFLAMGCTSEAQARRAGLWRLDTSLNQRETVSFSMFLEAYDLLVGDIVEIFDEFYAGVNRAGRLVSGSTTSFTLDRDVTVSAGATISIVMSDGTIEERPLNVSTTTTSNVFAIIGSPLPSAPPQYANYIITSGVSARQFRITKVALNEDGTVAIDAIQHDPNKYTRIETGVNLPAPVFSVVNDFRLSAVTGIVFEEQAFNDNNTIIRNLNVSWLRPTTGIVTKYVIKYRVNSSTWKTVETTTPSIDIENAVPGVYDFKIYAVGYNGVLGVEAEATYTVSVVGGNASPLNPVTNLVELKTGGVTFADRTLTVKWTNPSSNGSITTATLRDFQVNVYTTGDVLLRTTYVPAVPAGSVQTYAYSFDENTADGGPRRTLKVQVRCRDTKNNLSAAVEQEFNNPQMGAPSGVLTIATPSQVSVTYNKPTESDYAGTIVWMSTNSGFTPSAANKVFDGNTNFAVIPLSSTGTRYLRVAHYDSFGKSDDAVGMALSAEVSAAPLTNAGIPSGTVLPGSGSVGDLFYHTTQGQLYIWNGTSWEFRVLTEDLIGQITSTQIGDYAITSLQLADAAIIPRVISDLAITADKIAANAVTAEKILAGSITGDKIAANSIAASKLVLTDLTNIFGNGAFLTGVVSLGSGQYIPADWGFWPSLDFFRHTSAPFGGSGEPVLAALQMRVPTAPYATSSTYALWNSPESLLVGDPSSGGYGYPGAPFDTKPGEEFYFSISSSRDPGTFTMTNSISVIVGWVQNSAAAAPPSVFSFTPTTALQTFETVFTAPAGAVGFRVMIRRQNNGTDTAPVYVMNLVMRKKNAAQLIVDGGIVANLIQAGAIETDKLAANSITAGKIQAGAIETDKLAANAVTADKIAANTITSDKIAANTITADQIAANTLTAAQIAANAITATELAANSVTSTKIAADAVTASKINVSTLSAISDDAGVIINGQLQNSTGTTVLNLDATGSAVILRSGTSSYYGPYAGTHYPVEIKANGEGFFARGVLSGGQRLAGGTYTIPSGQRPAVYIFTDAGSDYYGGGA